ncbi:MAG: cytochrome c oxidase subunit II [Lentisphaerae bacterium]|nr:cytochrome c oxidase subunit II [Lentisphaerota bacterium]
MNKLFNFFPESASTVAGPLDSLIWFLIGLTIFFTLGIGLTCIYFAVRYRRRHVDEQPVQIEGNLKLEMLWTIIPLIIALGTFYWGTRMFLGMITRPPDAVPIYVVGKQWMWKIQHPDGRREINQFHIPIGTKFQLIMTSEDVIHSFYIPAFRVKMDVVPGRYSTIWFEATKEGVYHLFCTQYCGTSHSAMVGKVIVMSPAAYEEWLAGQSVGRKETMVEAGTRLFTERACVTCHDGRTGAQGPLMRGVFGKPVELSNGQVVVADESYVRESILKPQAKLVKGFQPVMPTFAGQLNEEQILQLIAYIRSIQSAEGTTGGQTK